MPSLKISNTDVPSGRSAAVIALTSGGFLFTAVASSNPTTCELKDLPNLFLINKYLNHHLKY
jgi:hypothetical protein